MKKKGTFRYQLLLLLLIPMGFILYNDALRAPFVYDDKGYILQNEAIRSLTGFDISGTRYLGFLSFALNYALGGLTPFDYHLVNVLIHIANAILVFFLVASMSKPPNTAVLGGQVQALFGSMPAVLPHAKSGKVRPLAVGTSKRSPSLPDVPTVAESGYPGYEASLWLGFIAPARKAKPIVDRLHKELTAIVALPENASALANRQAIA